MSEINEEDPITEEQIAEAEAEEADDSGDEEAGEEEQAAPEPEPLPEGVLTPEQYEQRAQKIERRAATYAKAVSEIMEEQALDLLPCPCCSATMHPMFVNKHDAGRYPDDVKGAVLTFLGFAQEQEYEADQEVRRCPKCDGKGRTATGSTVQGNETRQCTHCLGFGYFPPPNASDGSAPPSADFHYPAGEAPQPLAGDDADIAGDPKILPDGRPNPNFGLWPQYKVPVEPWGITAGLTAQDNTSTAKT